MLSKAKISLIKSLEHKKYRKLHGLFVAEGTKLVKELAGSSFEITDIFATREWMRSENLPDIHPATFIHECEGHDIQKASFLSTPQEVIALVKIPQSIPDISALINQPAILLDEIRDPGNLGTIIRTADWFGVKNIICSLNSVDVFNPKTVQATMGSITRVNVFYHDLVSFLDQFPSRTSVYAADMDGADLYNTEILPNPWIIIGNEANGISDILRKKITKTISIPRFGTGTESLNASIATAIILSEMRRRKCF